MEDIVIVAAKRTPIGSFLGTLAPLTAPQLGGVVIKNLLEITGIAPADVDEVIMGNVLTTGIGQNPARQAAIAGGVPLDKPATTVNVVCGSGLKAVQMAVQAIRSGDAHIVIAGGQESMSQSPHFMHLRSGVKMGEAPLLDSMIFDGLTDAYHGYHMGITAENIAERYGFSREQQNALALESQHKASSARAAGHFKNELVSVSVPQRKGEPLVLDEDEYIKDNVSPEGLDKLKPAFRKDGTVTAGNASGINDGAAAVVVMRASEAQKRGLPVLARIASYGVTGVEPEVMGLGPVAAVRATLTRAGWPLESVDLIEANEAFAAQALGVAKELNFDMAKVNVNGGAIALGHPIGASGCRILVTLLHEMQRRNVKRGLATLCVGGGMGLAIAVERP